MGGNSRTKAFVLIRVHWWLINPEIIDHHTTSHARERARVRARERELGQRREEVVGEHRRAADERGQQAELAERRARMAEQEAARERAAAQVERERAGLHERGILSDEEFTAKKAELLARL